MEDPVSKKEELKRKNRNPKIKSAVATLVKILPPPGKVLDLGVRDGFSTGELSKAGYDVIGTDVNKKFIKYARKKGYNVIYDDIMKTKLEGYNFDIIYGRHVLEHCAPTDEFFKQCAKVLTTAGVVFFIFPLEPKRKPGNHKVFFPTLEDFPGSELFTEITFCNSKDMGIIPFSDVKGEALYIGKLK